MTWDNSRQLGTIEPNPKGSSMFCSTGDRSSPRTNTLGCPVQPNELSVIEHIANNSWVKR